MTRLDKIDQIIDQMALADTAILAILAKLFGAAVVIFLGALVAQHAIQRIGGFKPTYLKVLLAAGLGYLAALVVGFVLGFASGLHRDVAMGTLLDLLIGFFIQAAFYTLLVKNSDGIALTYAKSCFVTLLQLVVVCAVLAVLVLILLGLGTLQP